MCALFGLLLPLLLLLFLLFIPSPHAADCQLTPPHKASLTRLQVKIPPEAFTYGYSTRGGPRLQAALAAHLDETFEPSLPLKAADVVVLDGATALHSVYAFALADPGDAILVGRPVYGRFELDMGNEMGVRVVYADTSVAECMLPGVAAARYEEALDRAARDGVRIRAMLVVNPSNPLGRCYPRETLVELMRLCQRRQLHFISDEVYGLSVFESGDAGGNGDGNVPFTSALSIDMDDVIDPGLVHVEYGTSKDFAAAGLRLGVLATRNQHVHRVLRAVSRFHEPSGVSVAVGTAMFEDRVWCTHFIELSRKRIAEAYRFATSNLRESSITYHDANAGFFVFINLEPWLPPSSGWGDRGKTLLSNREREFELAARFVKGGVFLHPGEEHALEVGMFRLVYTQKEEIVREGFKR